MELFEQTIVSAQLGSERKLWVEVREAARLCAFLDGELCRDRVGAPSIVDRLRSQGLWLDTRCVFVSSGDPAARHRDFVCQGFYNGFLLDELLPQLGASRPVYLVGLSLSGLAAVYAGCCQPRAFAGVISQSPSAWWNDQWVVHWASEQRLEGLRMWLSVGSRETGEDLRHEPSRMHQRSSQLEAVPRLAAAMPPRGAEVRFEFFEGGHDPACWAAELPAALAWLGRSRGS